MIIFFDKRNGRIFGVIEGRVHDKPELGMVASDVAPEDTGKYIVPFKTVMQTIEVPIKKWFIVNKKTMEAEERVVGVEKKEVPGGMTPDVSFANIILDFESGKENIYQYKVITDLSGVVTGFEKTV